LPASEDMQCLNHDRRAKKSALLTSLRFLVHRPFRFENRDFLQHLRLPQRTVGEKAYLIDIWLNTAGTEIMEKSRVNEWREQDGVSRRSWRVEIFGVVLKGVRLLSGIARR
jgi:hypothetical protein